MQCFMFYEVFYQFYILQATRTRGTQIKSLYFSSTFGIKYCWNNTVIVSFCSK